MSQPPDVRIQMNELHDTTPASEPTHEQRKREQGRFAGWERNDNNVLLVVATLVTTLTYQVGTNLPRGYYDQDDQNGHHQAGDSILHQEDRPRYWLFITASAAGFGNSMLMTLALLTGVRVESPIVRWPFIIAYSSLVLAFITSLPGTSLLLDILLWLVVLFILWAAISFTRLDGIGRKALSACKNFVSMLFRRR